MSNLCIIGGSGFVGTRLISELKDSHKLINVDTAPSEPNSDFTSIGDVREISSFEEQLVGRDAVVLLAAEHRDDVSPSSLYYDVNVDGMRNVLRAMDAHGVKKIVFTSSVAIYGMNQPIPPNESAAALPFNHYGKSKWEAENVLREWLNKEEGRGALILRPTVIFGEDNRGNVYNLLRQIYTGKFLMIGSGKNRKSMAYVGNIVAFIKHKLEQGFLGEEVYNYIDKPDFDMNTLVAEIYRNKGQSAPKLRIPYLVGIFGGYCFDLLALFFAKKLPISSIRVRKFCSSTEINSDKLDTSGFNRPFDFKDGLQKTLSHEFEK